jgi:hypothetical protein
LRMLCANLPPIHATSIIICAVKVDSVDHRFG